MLLQCMTITTHHDLCTPQRILHTLTIVSTRLQMLLIHALSFAMVAQTRIKAMLHVEIATVID